MDKPKFIDEWREMYETCKNCPEFLEDTKRQLSFVYNEQNRTDLAGQVLMLFEEEGLTYVEAFAVLQMVKEVLKIKSQFIQIRAPEK